MFTVHVKKAYGFHRRLMGWRAKRQVNSGGQFPWPEYGQSALASRTREKEHAHPAQIDRLGR